MWQQCTLHKKIFKYPKCQLKTVDDKIVEIIDSVGLVFDTRLVVDEHVVDNFRLVVRIEVLHVVVLTPFSVAVTYTKSRAVYAGGSPHLHSFRF